MVYTKIESVTQSVASLGVPCKTPPPALYYEPVQVIGYIAFLSPWSVLYETDAILCK